VDEQSQKAVHGHVQQDVHPQREDVRRHQPKTSDAGFEQQAAEGSEKRCPHRVDELLESRRLPGAERVQDDLQPDDAVDEVEEVVDDLRDARDPLAALSELGVSKKIQVGELNSPTHQFTNSPISTICDDVEREARG
jgi:hypothetical protein